MLQLIEIQFLSLDFLFLATSIIIIIIIIIINIIIIILLFSEFFTPVLADGCSLEFEWQQVSLSIQDSS